jgi:hypothetical protein
MFGDFNWEGKLYERQAKRYRSWLKQVDQFVVIEMGAGSSIPTVRDESERRAQENLIRINPREPEISGGSGISIKGSGLESLSRIKEYII